MVEDDPWYRGYLTNNLNERGFITVGVSDGEGLIGRTESPANLVILDVDRISKRWHRHRRGFENTACGVSVTMKQDRLGDSASGRTHIFKPVNINEPR